MTAEYSYFRAEGSSREAVDTVLEAKKEQDELRRKLCDKFGAEELFGGLRDPSGSFMLVCFIFSENKPPPEGWVDTQARTGSTIYAKPAPGSVDHFHVASITGLMERAIRQSRLEGVFGCGDMPMKDRPAGGRSGAFVRYSTMEDAEHRPGKRPGFLADGVTFLFGSNAPTKSSDPLSMLEMQGEWYIRVPNRAGSDDPIFIPPDAAPVSYDKMLEIDVDAWRRPYVRRARPGP
jgi:hypothetical protein